MDPVSTFLDREYLILTHVKILRAKPVFFQVFSLTDL